jgi:antibiotic biosynthesis monooxygenase (ABM) superfamily enzyme
MALLTWLAIFPLFLVINALLSPLLTLLPAILRTFVLTIVLVSLMTETGKRKPLIFNHGDKRCPVRF